MMPQINQGIRLRPSIGEKPNPLKRAIEDFFFSCFAGRFLGDVGCAFLIIGTGRVTDPVNLVLGLDEHENVEVNTPGFRDSGLKSPDALGQTIVCPDLAHRIISVGRTSEADVGSALGRGVTMGDASGFVGAAVKLVLRFPISGFDDNAEIYDGELRDAIEYTSKSA